MTNDKSQIANHKCICVDILKRYVNIICNNPLFIIFIIFKNNK